MFVWAWAQGLEHAHPMRSPKLWAARHDARAARLFSWSALRAALGLSSSSASSSSSAAAGVSVVGGGGGGGGIEPAAVRSHVIFGLMMSALGVYAGGRWPRGAAVGRVGGALLGLLAVLGAGGAGFVLGTTATLERLQLGKL
jgi:hypothetical protein|eukprot:COSAG06_NODE_422_length_15966_cov_34.618832_11_plen_142_part_00